MDELHIRKMIANSKRPRMGSSKECMERWPDSISDDPSSWRMVYQGRLNYTPDEYGLVADAMVQCGAPPLGILRIFYLDGSDHATWAVVTDEDDKQFILIDDLGD